MKYQVVKRELVEKAPEPLEAPRGINWRQVCYQIAAACIAVVLLAVFVSVLLVGLVG